MKTFTRGLGLLSLLFVPTLLGSCAGHADVASAMLTDTSLATLETLETASPLDPTFFDPYYSEDLYDGLWYYADASTMKPAAVAARLASPLPAPDSSPASSARVTLDLADCLGTARAVTST